MFPVEFGCKDCGKIWLTGFKYDKWTGYTDADEDHDVCPECGGEGECMGRYHGSIKEYYQ